jgi:hypothetical protein
MSRNFPLDPQEDEKECVCGHKKVSHKYAFNTWGEETAYKYNSCRKRNCDCSTYEDRGDGL